MADRITERVYRQFMRAYERKEYPHLRYGQAFLNKFFLDVSDPQLFYETNDLYAGTLIRRTYVL